MTLYWTDELEVELPPGFVDKSTQILEWKHDAETLSLAIQRDTNAARKRPHELLAAAQKEFTKRFPHFALEEAPQLELELAHASLAFRWMADHKALFQIQLVVELGDRLVIATASGVAAAREAVSGLLTTFAHSLRVRSP